MDWQLWALDLVALDSDVGILTAEARSWGTGGGGTFKRPHGHRTLDRPRARDKGMYPGEICALTLITGSPFIGTCEISQWHLGRALLKQVEGSR